MKKIIGIDVGTNSIGWAFSYEDDDDNSDLVDAGVRIIAAESTHAREFERGQSVTINETRRTKRGMRRSNQRYKHRRFLLNKELTRLNMLPNLQLIQLSALDLYGLRDKAVRSEKISLEELGRIFLHLNQKRGYRSNRKANADEKEATESETQQDENKPERKKGYLDLISDREKALDTEGVTIGQYFYHKMLKDEGKHVQVKKEIFLRASYMEEFDRIWEAQKKYYPEVLTDYNNRRLRDEIIYFQRRLKSQHHLISNCSFEKGHKAAARSSPFFQAFKIWQHVNNIKITNVQLSNQTTLFGHVYDRFGERDLTLDEKKKAFEYLDTVKDVPQKTFLKKVLGLNPNEGYALNFPKLEGNSIKWKLIDVFEKQRFKHDTWLTFDPLSIEADKSLFYRLYHLLYSVEEPNHIIEKLKATPFNFDESLAKALVKVNMPDDYGSLSVRAIKRLLPHLMKGMTYDKAREAVAHPDNDKKGNLKHYADHKLLKSELMEKPLSNQIDILRKGSLRQPVVEQIVNQVINVVNAIINNPDYGITEQDRADGTFEIRVELARELKSNVKQRKSATSRIVENTKNNDRIKLELEKLGVRVSLRNIEKYKLWEEQGGLSPYTQNPLNTIPLAKLFDSNMYEIEHVIPRSRFFDDSLNNKVIAETKENRDKDNMTAYEYMERKGAKELAAFVKFVNDSKFSKTKKERLLANEIPAEFVNRQLKETQYVTKALVEKLKEVSHNVWVSSGAITEYLRDKWGLNDVIKDLNWEDYKVAGRTSEVNTPRGKTRQIKDWSKREDHRHHAVDAIVIAFTRQGIIQSLNSLHAKTKSEDKATTYMQAKDLSRDKIEKMKPMPNLTERAKEVVSGILVSHRQKRKVITSGKNEVKKGKKTIHTQATLVPRGQLHKESVYGKIKRYEVVSLSTRFKNVDLIANDYVKKLVQARLDTANGDPSVAFKSYEKNPIYLDKAQKRPLMKVAIWQDEFVGKQSLSWFIEDTKRTKKIIDKNIRELVEKRFCEVDNPKKAFIEPLYFDKHKKNAISSVRCFTGLSDLVALHTKDKTNQPIDYVQTGGNHHLAIYQNEEGAKKAVAVSFWEAVERARQKQLVVQNDHAEHGKLVQTFAINDMFLIGIDPSVLDIQNPKNAALVSKSLYRVQKLTVLSSGSPIIVFRHHLETLIKEDTTTKDLKKFYSAASTGALDALNLIKIRINNLGKIERII